MTNIEAKRQRFGAIGATAPVFSSLAFHRLQLRHFALFDIMPLIAAPAILAFAHAPTAVDWSLFAIFWLATGLGVSVGFHRHFSHRSFETTPPIALTLLVLGSMAGRGPMISWAAMHRRHHQTSDREGDLHSPNRHGAGMGGRLRGLLHAHLTWMVRHDYPNVMQYVPDLVGDKLVARYNRRYYWWVALGLILPALIGGLWTASLSGAFSAFLWGGIVRLLVVEHTMSAINSVCHTIGTRKFTVPGDNSRNNAWLGLASWGEAFHNNHHAFPWSAAFGLRWHELDPGFWFIRALEQIGLVWHVKTPSIAAVIQRAAAEG